MEMQDKIETWKREFNEFLILKNHSKATIKSYNNVLKIFLEYYCAYHYFQPMTFEVARGFLLQKYKSGLSWMTININYSAIQKFFYSCLARTMGCTEVAPA